MIIRAYQLKRWDIFRKQGVFYLVVRVTDKEIVYSWWREHVLMQSGTTGTMGSLSQERVEYIGVKPKKKITKPIKEIYESSL